MDFEERLESAERSDSPSLVGASIRSADDSLHKNYIHPEKYKTSRSKERKQKRNFNNLKSSINASLDDLINEGALMNSEEDFEKFLDNDGSIKTDIKLPPNTQQKQQQEEEKLKNDEIEKLKNDLKSNQKKEIKQSIKQSNPLKDSISEIKEPGSSSSFYKQEDYSTPNLSEYQLDNDIKDHNNLLEHVQSYDYHKLPHSDSKFKHHDLHIDNKPIISPSPAQQQREKESNLYGSSYFHTERARSRSRSANPSNRKNDRSNSRSSINSSNPHLARGDTYKNVHSEEPTKYELPADLEIANESEQEPEEEEESDGRRSRQSKPTMGDSIAKAEKIATLKNLGSGFHDTPLTRDPSLVTTGDYTNFEADSPRIELPSIDNLYSKRSESSTNYLRSISRSRSRVRNYGEKEVNSGMTQDEKNDANTNTLIEEGALISDDPFISIDKLDTMVEEVLHVNDNTEQTNLNKNQLRNELNQSGQPEVKSEEIKNDLKKNSELNVENSKLDKDDEKESNLNDDEEVKLDDKEVETNEKNFSKEEDKLAEPKSKEEDKSVESAPISKDENNSADSDLKSKEEDKSVESGSKSKKEDKSAESDSKEDKSVDSEPKSKTDIPKSNDFEEPKSNESEITTKDEDKPIKLESKSDDLKNKVEGEVESTEKEAKSVESAPVKGIEDTQSTTAHEDLVEEDAIKESNNEKDNANPQGLIDEGALVDEDPLEHVDQENLKAKGITSDLNEDSSTKDNEKTDLKDIQEITEKNENVKTLLTGEFKEEEKSNKEDPEEYKEIQKIDDPVDIDLKTQAAKEEKKDEQVPLAPIEDNEGPNVKDPKEVESKEKTKKDTNLDDDDLSELNVSPEEIRKHLQSQPIYLFTSLAGGMQIMPRTNRLSTILQANGIKFEYRDLGTDEDAKKIWKRQSNGKTLPGIIRGDDFIGNWQEIDEANEEYRLQELLYETL